MPKTLFLKRKGKLSFLTATFLTTVCFFNAPLKSEFFIQDESDLSKIYEQGRVLFLRSKPLLPEEKIRTLAQLERERYGTFRDTLFPREKNKYDEKFTFFNESFNAVPFEETKRTYYTALLNKALSSEELSFQKGSKKSDKIKRKVLYYSDYLQSVNFSHSKIAELDILLQTIVYYTNLFNNTVLDSKANIFAQKQKNKFENYFDKLFNEYYNNVDIKLKIKEKRNEENSRKKEKSFSLGHIKYSKINKEIKSTVLENTDQKTLHYNPVRLYKKDPFFINIFSINEFPDEVDSEKWKEIFMNMYSAIVQTLVPQIQEKHVENHISILRKTKHLELLKEIDNKECITLGGENIFFLSDSEILDQRNVSKNLKERSLKDNIEVCLHQGAFLKEAYVHLMEIFQLLRPQRDESKNIPHLRKCVVYLLNKFKEEALAKGKEERIGILRFIFELLANKGRCPEGLAAGLIKIANEQYNFLSLEECVSFIFAEEYRRYCNLYGELFEEYEGNLLDEDKKAEWRAYVDEWRLCTPKIVAILLDPNSKREKFEFIPSSLRNAVNKSNTTFTTRYLTKIFLKGGPIQRKLPKETSKEKKEEKSFHWEGFNHEIALKHFHAAYQRKKRIETLKREINKLQIKGDDNSKISILYKEIGDLKDQGLTISDECIAEFINRDPLLKPYFDGYSDEFFSQFFISRGKSPNGEEYTEYFFKYVLEKLEYLIDPKSQWPQRQEAFFQHQKKETINRIRVAVRWEEEQRQAELLREVLAQEPRRQQEEAAPGLQQENFPQIPVVPQPLPQVQVPQQIQVEPQPLAPRPQNVLPQIQVEPQPQQLPPRPQNVPQIHIEPKPQPQQLPPQPQKAPEAPKKQILPQKPPRAPLVPNKRPIAAPQRPLVSNKRPIGAPQKPLRPMEKARVKLAPQQPPKLSLKPVKKVKLAPQQPPKPSLRVQKKVSSKKFSLGKKVALKPSAPSKRKFLVKKRRFYLKESINSPEKTGPVKLKPYKLQKKRVLSKKTVVHKKTLRKKPSPKGK